ncbi:MAG TPA: TonB-dependent receptor [Magnetospirillaceae bacterium]|nr:TonB-dependent receptor [Magnetospirillaceae bacterium]
MTSFRKALALSASLAPFYALADDAPGPIDNIVVTSSRVEMLGNADTASQGSVTKEEIDLRPVYRVGQLLETMPGLVVTVHSGEGKANQFLLRGENLDHGVDLAGFVDDMPVNRPTNTHGQGYSDLNFIMPQSLSGMDYTKGPYYASVGDFGAVGSIHMKLTDDLANQVSASVGTVGDQDLFAGGTWHFEDGGKLIGAVDLAHLDGPWETSQNFRKVNGFTRYSNGTANDGYSVTGLYYQANGNLTTDQPLRAIKEGVISANGSLDPSDGSQSQRWSLDGHYAATGDGWAFKANAFYIHSKMILWNDFTHYLDDPILGDQEQQTENRDTFGGGASFLKETRIGGVESEWTAGVQERYDTEFIDRRHTHRRITLSSCDDGGGPYNIGLYTCSADKVTVNDVAPYVENTTHWLSGLRSTIGFREDYQSATDRSIIASQGVLVVPGQTISVSEWLPQPKGSVAFGPWYGSEFYISGGTGFHSDDVRGVTGTVPLEGIPGIAGATPLMAKIHTYEIGFRTTPLENLSVQFAAFREDASSELKYDADAGQDGATAPTRRQGFEVSAQYHPLPWLELNTDIAATRARYFKNGDTLVNNYGIAGGTYVANSPDFIGSFGIMVDNLGPWYGGLEERILGPYPLADGPASPGSDGYKETNIDIGYKLTDKIKLQLAVYNLFNTHAWAAEYYYSTNINPAEAAKYGTGGVGDYQVHPLEPITARFTATVLF